MAHERRAAVTGTSDIEHIQVILLDDPVQVNINEILARYYSPGLLSAELAVVRVPGYWLDGG